MLNADTYAKYITIGVSLLATGTRGRFELLAREYGETGEQIAGRQAHKHQNYMTMLNILNEDPNVQCNTRFLDGYNVAKKLDKGHLNPELLLPSLSLLDSRSLLDFEEGFENVACQHAVDTHLTSGSMALWSEYGRVWHQALPTITKPGTTIENPKQIIRIALAHDVVGSPISPG